MQAPPYNPRTDFSDDEQGNVAGRSTVRTALLDAELAAVATSVNALRGNLALIQRDDGQVRDLAVGLHALDYDVRRRLGGPQQVRPVLTKLWEVGNAGEPIYSSPIFLRDFIGDAYAGPVFIYQSQDWHLYVRRADTGALLWRKAFGGPAYGRAQAADVDGDGHYELFGASTAPEGRLYCLDRNGAARWTFDTVYDRLGAGTVGSATAWSLVDPTKAWGGNLFLRGRSGVVAPAECATVTITGGLGAGQTRRISGSEANGTLWILDAWTTIPNATSTYRIDPPYPSDRAFMHAGTLSQEPGGWFLYVTGFDNTIHKLNAATGAVVWRYAFLENCEPYPVVLDIDGDGHLEVLFHAVDQRLYCLAAATGAVKWTHDYGAGADSFLQVADVDADGALEIVAGTRDGRVRVISHTGQPKARSGQLWGQGYESINSRPVLIPRPDGRCDFAVGGDGGIVQRFTADCEGVWRLHGPTYINSSPLRADVNYDGVAELIFCDMAGGIQIMSESGHLITTLLAKGGIEGVPICEDIDGDGLVEFVYGTTEGRFVSARFTR